LPSFARGDASADRGGARNHRSDIDGLRAMAILSVVVYHAFKQFAPGGFVGVDIFLVISGFLISGIILKGLSGETFSFVEFYHRRVRRILPALILVLAAIWAIGWFLLGSEDYVALGRQIAAAAVFGSNILLMHDIGYFSPSAELNPLLHLWSLAIEEQFYLVWPITLVLAWKARLNPVWVTALICIASFAITVSGRGGGDTAVFFSPITRSWELALGALLAAAEARHRGAVDVVLGSTLRKPGSRRFAVEVRDLSAWIGFGAIVASIALVRESQRYPSWIAALPTGGTFLLLAAGERAWVNRQILSRPLMVGVGLISYPLYLWHWPLLSLARVTVQHEPTKLTKLAVVAAAFALAWATTTYVERPIRTGQRSRLSRRVSVPTSLLVGLGGVAAVGLATLLMDGFPTRIPQSVRYLDTFRYNWGLGSRVGECLLNPGQDERDFGAGCVDPLPAGSQQPLVVLWGDSHAAHLYPGLKRLRATAGFALAQLTMSVCPPILDIDLPLRPACRGVNDFVMRRITELKPRIVVLAASWGAYPEPDLAKLDGSLLALKRAGVDRIVLIGPVPIWNPTLPKVLLNYYWAKRPERLPTKTTFGVIMPTRLDDRLHEVANTFDAAFVSAIRVFCDRDGCLVSLGEDPGNLTVWDSAHLTDAGSEYLARSIAQKFGLDQTADRTSNVRFH
jgi:peptidoglycan/LPS O-acetylase OafA/YrhL